MRSKINKRLYIEALNVIGGIHRMNAPFADYYGFNADDTGKEISLGEYLTNKEAMNKEGFIVYDYLLDLRNSKLYKHNDHNNKYYEIKTPEIKWE